MKKMNEIIERINSEGKDWPDEKKCRIIYNEVMRRARYNPIYSFLDVEGQKEIYNRRIKKQQLEDIYVVCSQVAMDYLTRYLNEVGIEATVIASEDPLGHVCVKARLKNVPIKEKIVKEKTIVLDTFLDLMNAKKGMKYTGYGVSLWSVMSDARYEIPEIPQEMKDRAEQYDIEEGYVFVGRYKNKDGKLVAKPIYLDDVIEQLKQEMNNEDNILEYAKTFEGQPIRKEDIEKYKVHFLVNFLKNNDGLDATGVEWKEYFKAIAEGILVDGKTQFIQQRLGNIKKSETVEMYMQVRYENGDIEHYLYDENEKGYVIKAEEQVYKHVEDIYPLSGKELGEK